MILALVATALAGPQPPEGGWPPPPAKAHVKSVYDGDTVTLVTGDKIRLRWVNTPELRPAEEYGIEARYAAENFLSGEEVTLLLGSENPRDGYGRVVAGLQTKAGNLSVYLIEQGLAHLFVIPPDDTDLTPFIEAQNKARAERVGIWSTDSYQGTLHITSFHANARGDDRENVNGEYLRVCNVGAVPANLDGFRITDISGQSFTLPDLVVPIGHTVKLHSGGGTHQKDPSKQLEIYLGSSIPIWNNKEDRATIYDSAGKVVDTRRHLVKKETP